MLGLHLVWCLWFSQKPIIIQDATEGVERIIVFTWQETQELFFKRNL